MAQTPAPEATPAAAAPTAAPPPPTATPIPVNSKAAIAAAKAAAAAGQMRVKAQLLNVRQGPGSSHSVLTTLKRGDTLPALEPSGDGWLKVQLPDQKVGWVFGELIEASKPVETPTAPMTDAQRHGLPADGVDYVAMAAELPGGQVLNVKSGARYWILQQALDAADEGAILCLGPGRFSGRVVIKKTVYLYGAGVSRTALELTRDSKDSLWIAEESAGGLISNLELVGGNSKLPVLEISGDWNGTIDSCRVRGGRGPSVLIGDEVSGTLKNVEITDAGVAALEVRGKAKPKIEACHIHDTKGGGIVVLGEAQPTLTGNRILGTGSFGMQIGDTAQPILEGNEIRDNIHDGIYVFGQAAPTLKQNEISGNARKRADTANLNFDEDSAGTVQDNLIEGAEKRPGVLLSDNAHPLLSGNRIERNKIGVLYQGRSFATLKDNTFRQNNEDEVDRRGKN